jgi:hypothetical protein
MKDRRRKGSPDDTTGFDRIGESIAQGLNKTAESINNRANKIAGPNMTNRLLLLLFVIIILVGVNILAIKYL